MAAKIYKEAVVVGAGPAGMGVALGLVRSGIQVVLLEKEESIGAQRRGETIRYDEEMDALLGDDFFMRQTIKKINKRTYFSHTGLKEVSRKISNPNLIINWTNFMQEMGEVLRDEGVEIRLATEVRGFMEQSRAVTGVKTKEAGDSGDSFAAAAVFSCGGHLDPASRYLKTDRSKIDFPVYKQLVKDYKGPDDRLEYYFHLDGNGLSIATIFPRGNFEAEIIIMSTSAGASHKRIGFDAFCREHPKFARRIAGTVPFYSIDTFIPMGGMIRPCARRPGLIMLGDAVGHVQARGGSGIKSAFMIGYTAGSLSADIIKSGRWSKKDVRLFNKELEKSPAYIDLKRHNLLYLKMRPLVFGRIRTPGEMDKVWPLLKHALR